MKYSLIIAGLLACATTVPATAQSVTVRPGLWQFSIIMKSETGAMEKLWKESSAHMDGLTPEQRKQAHAKTAGDGEELNEYGMLVKKKECIAPELAESGYAFQPSPGCSKTGVSQSGNTIKMSFNCISKFAAKLTEELIVLGPTSVKIKSVSYMEMEEGKPDTVTVSGDGVWLSAECGSIKPSRQYGSPR